MARICVEQEGTEVAEISFHLTLLDSYLTAEN